MLRSSTWLLFGAIAAATISSSCAQQQEQYTCTSEGFHVNPNDCKKFIRCVDVGRGRLSPYHFNCPIGTEWDEAILTCNWSHKIRRPTGGLCAGSIASQSQRQPPGQLGQEELPEQPQQYNGPQRWNGGGGGGGRGGGYFRRNVAAPYTGSNGNGNGGDNSYSN